MGISFIVKCSFIFFIEKTHANIGLVGVKNNYTYTLIITPELYANSIDRVIQLSATTLIPSRSINPLSNHSIICGAEELQASGRPAVRAVRQLSGIRTHHLVPAAGPLQVS